MGFHIKKKQNRRDSFDLNARLYDRVRPGYPQALTDDIVQFSGIDQHSRILDIGCGSGQATMPFTHLGCQIDCVEPGEHLARITDEKLRPFRGRVINAYFEEVQLPGSVYDLVFSATAFHWIDHVKGYERIIDILKTGGTLALFWNRHVATEISADYYQALQDVYRDVVPSMAENFKGLPHPESIETPELARLGENKSFHNVTLMTYPWQQTYSAKEYTDLLSTYSDVLILEETKRRKLLDGIRTFIDTHFEGRIIKEYLAVLYLAKKKSRM